MIKWAKKMGYNIHTEQGEKWMKGSKFRLCYNFKENVYKMIYP